MDTMATENTAPSHTTLPEGLTTAPETESTTESILETSGNVAADTEGGVAEIPAPTEKKHVSGDDLYRRSSQYQTWSFSSAELHEKKQQANENGRQVALALFESTRAAMVAEKPEVFAEFGLQLTSSILELISFEEEQRYLHFFGQQIVQICAHFKMPTQVKATAISFFRKFYLVNSVMEYRPRNILYTAVFLAAKLENYFISIDTFCLRLPKTKPEDILGLEFIILLALKFSLLVHHAFRPLYGFFLDFQLLLLHPAPAMYDVNVDTIGQLYDRAKTWLNDHALLSDAPFLYTPPQIALAALYDTDKRITERYLRLKFLGGEEAKNQADRDRFDLHVRTIKKCIKIAKQETATSREESTKIDEKCFFALNPQKLLKRRIKALQEGTPA
ncbi:cyclin H [Metschnikowia aff. pulcherrima]|uniref:Cyclin H n=1 Tax=Metschnikowia aff. pulcherrima TaxID=2163413 RepID=A0A4P6XR59_9ASCO|nr:cyclin H [Metschnikowia aff. pulcherrima]